MKTVKTFLFALLIVALVGCNNTNRDRTDDIDNNDLNIEDNSDDMKMDDNNSNLNTGNMDDDRTAMYKQLNMTPEQIQRFEKENPNFRDSINNSLYGRNATMDNSLRNILSADQYKQYESWIDNRGNNGNNINNSDQNNKTDQNNMNNNSTSSNNSNSSRTDTGNQN